MTGSSPLEQAQARRAAQFFAVFGWMSNRWGLQVPPIVTLDYLRSLPPDSFGHAWAAHLEANNLQPFGRAMRRLQLHDGVHTLTGYGTDPLGEAEVQAFLLGAKFRVIHGLLLLGLLRSVHQQRRHRLISLSRAEVRARLEMAYRRGCHAQFDPDTWQPEQWWEQSLIDVQRMMGL